MIRLQPICTLFPYTTLFRSHLFWKNDSLSARAQNPDGSLSPSFDDKQAQTGFTLGGPVEARGEDRKSTRLNSSHLGISYAVFCLKKKKTGESASSEIRSSTV